MDEYQNLFWRDYAHQLSDQEDDRLSAPEKTQLDTLTAQLRQENPTEIGGYAVHSSHFSFSGDFDDGTHFYDTRDAAEQAATDWKNRPDYEVEVPGIHEPETMSHHARIMLVTAAAMERVRQGGELTGGGLDLTCKINGQDALCVEYEHGLDIRTEGYEPPTPLGLSSGGAGGQTAPILEEGSTSMSDNVEQVGPSEWKGRGDMVSEQKAANEWAKEIAQAAKAHENAGPDRGMEQSQGMGR